MSLLLRRFPRRNLSLFPGRSGSYHPLLAVSRGIHVFDRSAGVGVIGVPNSWDEIGLAHPSKIAFSTTSSSSSSSNSSSNSSSASLLLWIGAAALVGASILALSDRFRLSASSTRAAIALSGSPAVVVGEWRPDLPVYCHADVAKRNKAGDRVWVSYRAGVYDVTDFLPQHPGGPDNVLRAAGSSLEPFWRMYSQHLDAHVYEILEEYRIGNLEEAKALVGVAAAPSPAPAPSGSTSTSADPYAFDPRSSRSGDLIVRNEKPFNAETPSSQLALDYLTPTHLFYVRNHLPVPVVDSSTYFLTLEVEGKPPVRLSLADLESRFPQRKVVATLMCAGNRRNEMAASRKGVRGGSWDTGAISTAEWSGIRLRDVLKASFPDLPDDYQDKSNSSSSTTDNDNSGNNADPILRVKHIQFEGNDTPGGSGSTAPSGESYGASIPLELGLNPRGDVILATRMNGAPIPADHGYPVRVVVPGVIGARSVKWLSKLRLSEAESPSQWQQRDYKIMPPNVSWEDVDWSTAPAVHEMPVMSAICQPAEGDVVVPNAHHSKLSFPVRGYAISGGGNNIARVDVSVDGGRTWTQARLSEEALKQPRNRGWAWTPWVADVVIPESALATSSSSTPTLDICCRAVDVHCQTQPEHVASIWNIRGLLTSSWHHVHVQVDRNGGEITPPK